MNILITGATSGIGKEIVKVLMKNNDLFLAGRKKLNRINYFSGDLMDLFEVEALYNKASKYFNSILNSLTPGRISMRSKPRM